MPAQRDYPAKPAFSRRLRVLLVEDQPADAELLILVLKKEGREVEVRCVASETEFRQALDDAPDVVLADYHIPGFGGMHALGILRELPMDTPFILVSGTITEQQAIEALRAGADDFLLKDRLGRLGSAIDAALERRRLRNSTHDMENRLRAFLENSPSLTFIKDNDGRYLHVNPRFLQAFGLSASQVLGKTDGEIFEAGQAGEFRANDRRVTETGAAITFEEHPRYADGPHTSLVTKFPLTDEAGNIYATGGIAIDITERHAIEQRNRATFEHSPAGIVHTGIDGRFIDANPAACAALGYERAELLGKNFLEVTHKDDRDGSLRQREHLLASPGTGKTSREKRYVRKDGTVIWTAVSTALVRRSDGAPDYFMTMIEDISTRRAAERRFRMTFEQATVGIVHTSLDDRYLLANQRFCEMLGYTVDEVLAMNTLEVVHPDDRRTDMPRRQLLLANAIKSYSGEKRFRRKDGSYIWVNRTVSLARDEDGTPLHLIRVIEDISRRKEQEERFHATFEQSAVGIALNEPDGRYISMNDCLCRMLGYTREELLSKNAIDDITHPEDRQASRERIAQLLNSDVSHVYAEKRYLCKDGSVIRITRSLSLVRNPDGSPRYLISMITDVTGQRATEDLFTTSFEQAGVGMSLRLAGARHVPWLRVNQKLCEILGYSREELMQLNVAKITLPEDQDEAVRLNGCIQRGEMTGYSRERRYLRKDGSVAWCYVTISAVPDPNGKPSLVISVIQDITARKEAEALLEQTFEQAAVGIARVDLDRVVITANRKFCEMTGYSKEELVGMPLRRISHPDDRGRDTEGRMRLLAGEIDHLQSERRYIRKDGETIWVRRTTSIARDVGNNNQNYIIVVEDITSRKLAEDGYRASFEMAPVGIMHTAADRRILDVNPKLCEILGYTRDELLQMDTGQLVTPDYLESDRPHYMQQMLSGELQTYCSRRPYMRKDGSTVWTNRYISMVRDSAGKPLYFLRMIEDISERKRFEDALVQERQLLRTVVDNIPDRIFVKDLEGRFILQNANNLRVHGVKSHEDIIGKTVFDLFPPDMAHRLDDEDRRIMASGQPLLDREGRTHFGGQNKPAWTGWHLTSKVPLKKPDGTVYGLVGVNRDITERKLAEQRILRLNRFFSTLSATNAAIVRARDRDSLLAAICRIAVTEGGLASAWIRLLNPKTGELAVVAQSGISKHYFEGIRVTAEAGTAEGKSFGGIALRENRIMVSNDMLQDPLLSRWRARAVEYGFRALATLPLSCNGEVIGLLSLQARETGFFDGELVNLLQEMAGDISFALTNLSLQERHQATLRALQESDEQFRQLAQHIPQVFWITDAEQRSTLYVSPNYATITGLSTEELENNPKAWLAAIHEDDRDRVQYWRREKAPDGTYDIEYRVVRPDGSIRWVHDRAFPIHNVHGEVYRIAGIASDITDTKKSREQLSQLAHYDSLTHLPNRVLFNDRLRQSMGQARRSGWTLGLLFLDLDRFKLVNDTLGHSTGDLLLRQVAARLTACLRPTDTVARLSGDEFAVILPELAHEQNAGLVAKKILDAMAIPFNLEGHEIFITLSIGITLYPADSDDLEALIRNADAAMYSAKAGGRNNFQHYTAEMNTRAAEKLQLETRMRRAIERHEFVLHYQPKVDIENCRISGLEALLRWKSTDSGLVPPAQFIPLLEETGLIVQVGEWVAHAACQQIKAWREAGIEPVPVAINLSARQLRQQGFSHVMKRALDDAGIEPGLIQIEITESSLMENPEEAIIVLGKLNTLGIQLAADDFGTGYSSLSYLKRLPLDALKIDRSFVNDITVDADDAVIARTVITLAHSLGLKVVAEGIETEAQLALLAANGCDEAQGYLFAKPLPADECAVLLAAGQPLYRGRRNKDQERAPSVLIVDDDEDHLLLSKLLLQKDGHQVLVATSTRQAFELLATNPVGVVMADLNMPEMNGIEFLGKVKLMYPSISRFMLSGAGDFATATRALNEGAVHKFFVKGQDEMLLRSEIRKSLRSNGSNQVMTDRELQDWRQGTTAGN